MRSGLRIGTTLFVVAAACPAAHLTRPAEQAFASYITGVEARLARQHGPAGMYLASLDSEQERHDLLSGRDGIEPVNGGTWEIPGGLLHHWRAAAFVPGATPDEMASLLRDYNHLAAYYGPEVVSARALSDHGGAAAISMRFRKHKILTVVLDAEFDVRNGWNGSDRGYSVSRSTHIGQVDAPGTPREHRRPEGDDDGFLWRLNSYWSFLRTADGLLIECEAVSLTRDVPSGLGWLVRPVIRDLPRESLQFTLQATKTALARHAAMEAHR